MPTNRYLGFSLIELSIVLIVVGLLAGSLLTGYDLIRSAELARLQRQYTEIITAIKTFQAKYNCLPGDCRQATSMFGSLGAVCPDLAGIAYTHTVPAILISDTPGDATCNGDGDGQIDVKNSLYEMQTVWQHLAAARLIGGAYTGGTYHGDLVAPGVNCPWAASVSRCWTIFDGDQSTWMAIFTTPPPVAIVPVHLGTVLTPVGQIGSSQLQGTFTAAEAASYDMKYDDGSPVSGSMLIAFGSQRCTDGDESVSSVGNATAKYLANDPAFRDRSTCNLIYRTGF